MQTFRSRNLREQRGQTTILIAVCLMCLLGLTGFAVDAGMMFRAKRMLQTAADAGAIAGAAELRFLTVDSTTLTAVVDAATAQNGMTNGSNGVTVTVNNPPATGSHTGSAYVEVIVSQVEPTYFMQVLHVNSMTVSARAVAGNGPASGCIYTLDTSGTDIGMTGSGTLSMANCGIVVDSASSSALKLTGSASITAESIGIVGGYSETGSGTISPTPVTGLAPAADPLAWLTPPSFVASSCLADPHFTGSSSNTIGPTTAGGTICYDGLSMTGSGSLTMQAGTYIINGGFSQTGSGSISGSNVTIYLAPPSGSLSLTGSGSLNVTAPTSGTYNGVLFYENPSDTNAMKITGSGGSDMEGIFYAPAASLTLTGSAGSSFYADLVVSSLSITGSGSIANYSSKNSSEPLSSAVVVE
jgi:Flp pilus assembly protein TadG